MEDDIFKRILQNKQFHLQLKSEQKKIIQNVLERKDSMAVLPMGFGKSMCYFPPSHFGQGKIIYANIVVFSKCLKNKLTWRNDRVYVKIVLYSSVTPLSEGKMVMNE